MSTLPNSCPANQIAEAIKQLHEQSALLTAQKDHLRTAICRYRGSLEVDLEHLLTFQLFGSLDTHVLHATTEFLKFWNDNIGKLVAIPHPSAPTQWVVGIFDGINMAKSWDSWISLSIKDDQVVVVDVADSQPPYISFETLGSTALRFGTRVYYDGHNIRTVTNVTTANDYHVLAQAHRLFCIAAHLLNAVEQVPSDLMREAISKTFAARDKLLDAKQTLIVANKVFDLYKSRTSLNVNDARTDVAQRDILRFQSDIDRITTDFPEIQLLSPEPTDESNDSDVRPLDPKNTAEIVAVLEEQFGGDLNKALASNNVPVVP